MASIITGGGVTNIIGSHAGNTFARNKGGLYMKKKSSGVNPRSQKQLAMRTTIGQLSKHYSHTLTDAQRLAWATFAASNPVINRLGNTSFLSAQQMFTKLNALVLATGGSISSTPPASTAVGTPSTLTIDAVSTSFGHLHLTNSITATSGSDVILYWMSPPLNPGRGFISSQLRRTGSSYAINALNNVTSDYLTAFGLLPTAAGQRIICRMQVVNTSTGITSAQLQATAFWT